MKLTVVLDRVEGDIAVLLAGEVQISWPRQFLPANAQESDLIVIELTVDEAATLQAKAETAQLFADLTAPKPDGDSVKKKSP